MSDPKKLVTTPRDNKWFTGLIGPTVADDIRLAISRHGAEAVKEEVKRQTKSKRGRTQISDWPELRDVFQTDAREWLNGGDPQNTRSNYSIAKEFADRNPGHSHPGTMKRIERKLQQKRELITLMNAEFLSRDAYPYTAHVRALEALTELGQGSYWARERDQAKSTIADYEAKYGTAPPSTMTMAQVEEATRKALMTLGQFAVPIMTGGLAGLPSIASDEKE